MDIKNINVFDLVEEAINLGHPQQRLKNIRVDVKVDKDLEVLVDEHVLYTVIRNLYFNAVKYTRPDGNITIQATRDNGKVNISVQDNGIGMTSEEISMLFTLSGTSKPGTMNEKGTGIGLIVCKEYIERCNGTIQVSSLPDKGSTFTIVFCPGIEHLFDIFAIC